MVVVVVTYRITQTFKILRFSFFRAHRCCVCVFGVFAVAAATATVAIVYKNGMKNKK